MSYAKNCPGTRYCRHKKRMGQTSCSLKGCNDDGVDRAHVHVDGSMMTSLIMLCRVHNNPGNSSEFAININAGIVDLPDCDCCSCGCNGSSTGHQNNPELDCCNIL